MYALFKKQLAKFDFMLNRNRETDYYDMVVAVIEKL